MFDIKLPVEKVSFLNKVLGGECDFLLL